MVMKFFLFVQWKTHINQTYKLWKKAYKYDTDLSRLDKNTQVQFPKYIDEAQIPTQ